MRWKDLAGQNCSMARALAVLGDRWTLMILRDCFMRVHRFDDFQKSLGIARRVLAERLDGLVGDGVLERRAYQDSPPRHEYHLTEKGLDLFPVMLSIVHWADRHCAGADGPPVLHRHKTCGKNFRSVMCCSECGEPIAAREVSVRLSGKAEPDQDARQSST
jgi:DNA-binding HxlR family transcriptional regulator